MDEKPNEQHIDEENSEVDNNAQVNDNSNATSNEEPFIDICERTGKRKEEKKEDCEKVRTNVIFDDIGTSTSNCRLGEKKVRLNSDHKFSKECQIDLTLSLYIRDGRPGVECSNSSTIATAAGSASSSIRLFGVELNPRYENQHYPSTSENPHDYPRNDNNHLDITDPELPEVPIVNQRDNLREAQVDDQNNLNVVQVPANNIPDIMADQNNLNAIEMPANNIPDIIAVQPGIEPQGHVNVNANANADANVGWPITKNLTISDVTARQNRLLIGSDLAEHIMDHLTVESRQKVEEGRGISVIVHDQDTNEDYWSRFNKFPSTQGHVLNDRWYRNFVTRRNLQLNDQIGLRWDAVNSILIFSVLNRAPR
ncbi:hypothetical protein vseg_002374 [Gypsophila vaccaria]